MPRSFTQIRRDVSSRAAASPKCVEGKPRSRNVVIEFPELRGGARLLPLAGIPGKAMQAAAARMPTADIVVIEGYDGPQPYVRRLSARFARYIRATFREIDPCPTCG